VIWYKSEKPVSSCFLFYLSMSHRYLLYLSHLPFFLQFSCINTYWRCATCWCFWDNGFEESLICCWLVIQVTVLFFVTFYFCSQICDPLSLSLSLSLLCVCVNMHIHLYVIVCLNSFYCGDAERILTNSSNLLGKISIKHYWIYLTGAGKSQFLKFAAKLSNRSVITTGLRSTSAGLTVTAVKDGSNMHIASTLILLSEV
jgi:hypothetical protein